MEEHDEKPEIENLLTPAQAALLKGVSRNAIYKAIHEGRLPHLWQLERFALREIDVLNWIPASQGGKRQRPPQSSEAKASISQAQTKRWQRIKNSEQI